ncbi:MAG: transglycosylase domain-containing protein, partial [Tepidiformaceae bacterium]
MNTLQKRRRLRVRRENAHRGRPWLLIALLSLLGLGSLCAAAGVGSLFVVYNTYAKDYVPIDQKLHQSNAGLTEIFDRNGPCEGTNTNCVKLGDLTNPDAQLLEPVTLDKISPYLIQATISTEDNSFETNPGVNVNGLFRAGVQFLLSGGDTSEGTGGSSITQQLVKNVYICPNVGSTSDICSVAPRTVSRKLREIVYALELEKSYSKDQILQWYLNQISYADRYIGIQAAAQGYFHINAADLDLAQSALLAGVPQFPTKYHPRLNCVKDDKGNCIVDDQGRTTVGNDAITRQHEVLDLMVTHHRITQAQADAAKAEVVKVYAISDPQKSSAFIDDQVEPYLVRMCDAGELPKLPSATNCQQSVHAAGWKVTTTLDWAQTDAAEQLLRQQIAEGLDKDCACNNAALITIEPTTGQIIVYAPNRDPTFTSDPRVAGDIDQLVEINQPGSSFKPAVYLAWFDDLTKAPMSTIWDTSPLDVEGTSIVDPRADGGNEGLITAYAGLGGSQNVPAFRAASEAGVDNVIAMAKKLGITTLDQGFDPTFRSHPDIQYGASIATGGANVKAVDMAYMNATIGNMGMMIGVPTLAKTVPLSSLKSLALTTGADYDQAYAQSIDFR